MKTLYVVFAPRNAVGLGMSFVQEMWLFLRSRKKLWLAPLLVVMAMFGLFIAVTSHSSIAPFLYTLF